MKIYVVTQVDNIGGTMSIHSTFEQATRKAKAYTNSLFKRIHEESLCDGVVALWSALNGDWVKVTEMVVEGLPMEASK